MYRNTKKPDKNSKVLNKNFSNPTNIRNLQCAYFVIKDKHYTSQSTKYIKQRYM